jgi:hypothetical protein
VAIFTGTEKRSVGSEMGGVVDAGSAFSRVEPLLTVDLLKKRFLFGIPLYSFLPNPVTRKRDAYSDEMLKDAITRGVNQIELMAGVDIQPVEHVKRLPYDKQEYYALGYFQLPNKPVTKVVSLVIRPSGDLGIIYRIDPAWLESANLQRGQVNILPLLPAGSGGVLPSPTPGAGGSAFLTILGSMGWVPALWEIDYISGFQEGRVPLIVNELIGCTAAINVLSEIEATNRVGQFSVGLDGAQQSVNTGGSQVYEERIKKLMADQAALLNKLKKKFGQGMFSSNV